MYDLNYGMIRSRLLRWALPLLQTSKKIIFIVQETSFKYVWPFWVPYLKSRPLLPNIRRKVLCCCTFLVLQLFKNSVLEISVQVSFSGQTCNSLKESYRNEMKGVYCSECYSKHLLFYNAFKNFEITGKRLAVLTP